MAEKVRSNLYQVISTLSDSFHKHLKIAQGLTEEQYSVILQYLQHSIQAVTERGELVARQSAAKELGGNEKEVLVAYDVLKFFGDTWNPIRDDVNTVLNDFKDLELLPADKEQRNVFLRFLESYLEFLQNDSDRQLDNSYACRFLPSLVVLNTGIDFRVVVESEYDWVNDDPKEYDPIIQRTLPIVILQFKLDNKEPIVFQVEPQEIKMIINKLQATLKELDSSNDLMA